MTKKAFDKKAVKQFIMESRHEGKSDQEIYNDLSQHYFDKKRIALQITGTVTPENKRKYKVYNNILLGLLLVAVLSRVLLVINLTFETGKLWALLLLLIVPLFAAYIAFEVARYNASIYRSCGILSIVGFTQIAGKMQGAELFISLLFATAVVWLSFYIDSKMFPKYKPTALKKDSNGEYILD